MRVTLSETMVDGLHAIDAAGGSREWVRYPPTLRRDTALTLESLGLIETWLKPERRDTHDEWECRLTSRGRWALQRGGRLE